ncbi:MAG TPA: hypothetical protein VKZ50_21115 [bacterium]|nr:hypothetical protein [bacterium]
MDFEYVEYEYFGDETHAGERISSLLTDSGYQSLRRDTAELVRRYLPGVALPVPGGRPEAARTVDALIPPADSTARVLLCERPAPNGTPGTVVSILALGRSQNDAHRVCTAVRLVLDTEAVANNGAARIQRFRHEWLPILGLDRPAASPASGARPLAAAQALLALQHAPLVLGRPSILRSRTDTITDHSRTPVDPEVMDRLVPEKFVERAFVLVCRESGQIVGIGEDATEVETAMPLTLRCPHCRRPLSEEAHDVLYSLSAQGEEFIRSTRWIREAVEAALQRRHCDTVAVAEGTARSDVDLAALCHDTVLLFRARESAPSDEDIRTLADTVAAFERAVPGVLTRGVYVMSHAASPHDAGTEGTASCTVLELSRLDAGLDRLLEDVKQDNFVRLTGSELEMIRPDPGLLLPSTA